MSEVKAHIPKTHSKSHAHKGKVTHIHVKPAGNGFIVHHDREQPKMKNGMMPPSEPSPQPQVFTDAKSAQDHIGQLMGQAGVDSADADAAPVPAKVPPK